MKTPVVNPMLLRTCALLWLLGMIGMWVARAVLALEPESLPFQLTSGLWILGGLGYTGLALHGCSVPECAAGPKHGADLGDISAVLRRG